jgi:hypothetical protein
MPEINKDKPNTNAQGNSEKPPRSSWRELLLRPVPWVVVTYLLLQIVERIVEWAYHDSIKTLQEFNTQLADGVRAVQPWRGAEIFWNHLMANWPTEQGPGGIVYFLLGIFGRIISSGLVAISLPLSDGWATAIPTLVGYGLGLYITWILFKDSRGELNFIIGIIGTIFIGGLCLVGLQPLMVMITGISKDLIGTVGGGGALLLSLPVPLSKEFITHVIHNRAEARLERVIEGANKNNHDPIVKVDPPVVSPTGNTIFRLKGYQAAKVVALSGTFNNWNQSTTVLSRGVDEWLCRINLTPGEYQYKFLVDGQWIIDPGNPNTKEDGNGHVNSVLVIRSM